MECFKFFFKKISVFWVSLSMSVIFLIGPLYHGGNMLIIIYRVLCHGCKVIARSEGPTALKSHRNVNVRIGYFFVSTTKLFSIIRLNIKF